MNWQRFSGSLITALGIIILAGHISMDFHMVFAMILVGVGGVIYGDG